ncbi:hypothetical protein Bca4012_067645 [Brassica carinata]
METPTTHSNDSSKYWLGMVKIQGFGLTVGLLMGNFQTSCRRLAIYSDSLGRLSPPRDVLISNGCSSSDRRTLPRIGDDRALVMWFISFTNSTLNLTSVLGIATR